MPIYEYQCKKCGKVVELLQKMGSSSAGVCCPGCGQDTLTKVLSVTAPAQIAQRPAAGCEIARKQGGCGGCCHGGH